MGPLQSKNDKMAVMGRERAESQNTRMTGKSIKPKFIMGIKLAASGKLENL